LNYVQYGCGLCAPNNWQNFDSSPSLVVSKIPILKSILKKHIPPFPSNVKYGNIVKGLNIPDESVELVYASHVLEHLSLDEFRTALKNTYKILRKDGIFRLVVPDLEWCIKQYNNNPGETRSFSFMKDAHLGLEKKERGIIGYIRNIFGQSRHLWMWDYDSLKIELASAGFKNSRRAQFNDSIHPAFKDVEDEDRFLNCLAVECSK
jgi:ubiquinone/menaquinone biosynthesis C-methylase UbiE